MTKHLNFIANLTLKTEFPAANLGLLAEEFTSASDRSRMGLVSAPTPLQTHCVTVQLSRLRRFWRVAGGKIPGASSLYFLRAHSIIHPLAVDCLLVLVLIII